MRPNFETFLSQLQHSNQTLDFFCDFDKITHNIEEVRLSLCMLNSLIGTADLKRSVEVLWNRDPSAFQVLGMLVAVRDAADKIVVDSSRRTLKMSDYFSSIKGILEFLYSTGLARLFQERRIENLVDYVFGIETGLDSNARKNRSGLLMQNAVASVFSEHQLIYEQEVSSNTWPAIANVLGKDNKRFDFVIERPTKTYLVEVNFYSGGGSKPNEVARAYTELGPKVNSVEGFEFVWITDGVGWLSARRMLEEAYNTIPHIYNMTSVHDFLNSI